MRIVSWFSCGATSAVATKLVLTQYGRDQVVIINAFVLEEHEDNRRFLNDCERWFDHPVTILMNDKYHGSTDEVWMRHRYMKGQQGAPCSQKLKRDLLSSFDLPGDVYVLGYTCDEQDRLDRFIDANNGRKVLTPLIDQGLSKSDCLAIVRDAGITIPAMYLLGYPNNNCIGCVKGGQNYWQRIRSDFPQRFVQIQTIQERIGPGASFLRFRSGPRKGERMSLAELPAGRGNLADEPDFSCGVNCELVEEVFACDV